MKRSFISLIIALAVSGCFVQKSADSFAIFPEEYNGKIFERVSGKLENIINPETRQLFFNEYFCMEKECSQTGNYAVLIKYLDCGDVKKPVSLYDAKTQTLYFYAGNRFQKVVEKKSIKNPAIVPQNQNCGKN